MESWNNRLFQLKIRVSGAGDKISKLGYSEKQFLKCKKLWTEHAILLGHN